MNLSLQEWEIPVQGIVFTMSAFKNGKLQYRVVNHLSVLTISRQCSIIIIGAL